MLAEKNAFTLVELMTVIAVVGILGAVAVPRYLDMVEKSREGATKGNLGSIKSSVSLYYANNTGRWPENIDTQSFHEYANRIPAVSVKHQFGGHPLSGRDNTVETITSINNVIPEFLEDSDGWRYDSSTGSIWVNNSQTDTTGTYYTYYGRY